MNQFETWATFNIKGAYLDKSINKEGWPTYENHLVQIAWEAWQACYEIALKDIHRLEQQAFSQGEIHAGRELHKHRYESK